MSVSFRKLNTSKVLLLAWLLLVSLFFTVATAGATVVSAQFTGLSGNSQNGEYTYPYYISLNGGVSIAMMCDDFFHGSSVGDTWLANLTVLSSGDLSNTRFGDATEYAEAAFLLRQLKTYNTAEWGNINWAVWKTFNPSLNPGAGPSGTLGPDYWYNLAQSVDVSTVDLSGVEILTPLDARSGAGDQEFLFITPEPSGLLLMGSGLLGVWSQRKRFL